MSLLMVCVVNYLSTFCALLHKNTSGYQLYGSMPLGLYLISTFLKPIPPAICPSTPGGSSEYFTSPASCSS
jgi:hypothetical protein